MQIPDSSRRVMPPAPSVKEERKRRGGCLTKGWPLGSSTINELLALCPRRIEVSVAPTAENEGALGMGFLTNRWL